MLATFQGVVEKGQVRWISIAPPEGATVVVVAQELPSVEEQLARLHALSPEEWRKPFDEFMALAQQGPAPEMDIATVSDQELVDVVHEVREEVQKERERAGRR